MNRPPEYPNPSHTPAAPAPPASRPSRRRGHLWSGGLALAAVLLFAGSALFGASPPFPEPEIEARFTTGESVTFEVGEGEESAWGAYGSNSGDYGSCLLEAPSGNTTRPEWDSAPAITFGGWGGIGVLETPEPGTYTLACSGTSGEYAVGGSGPLRMVEPSYVAIRITAFGIAPLLLLTAIVVGVVTALRRGTPHA